MKRRAGCNQRVVAVKLCSKVDTFFEILFAGSEFTADRKITAPGSAASRHAYVEFSLERFGEKLSANSLQASLKVLVDSVPYDVKESELAAGLSNLRRHPATVVSSGNK